MHLILHAQPALQWLSSNADYHAYNRCILPRGELAEHVGLNASYLSRLFKKETGISVSEYIQQLKIDTAQNMLLYSDFTPARISSVLAFPDQSYFTQVFKKYTGMTPMKFRSMHLREISLNEKKPSGHSII